MIKHGFDIGEITVMAPFKFGQGLTVGIIVIELDRPVFRYKDATGFSVGEFGYEVGRIGQLDVY